MGWITWAKLTSLVAGAGSLARSIGTVSARTARPTSNAHPKIAAEWQVRKCFTRMASRAVHAFYNERPRTEQAGTLEATRSHEFGASLHFKLCHRAVL